MVGLVVVNAVVLGGLTALLWVLSLRLRDASIVDIFWGSGFVVVAVVGYVYAAPDPIDARHTVVLLAVGAWGTRLSGYLAWRNTGKGEDRRYRAMRRAHGARFPIVSLFTVFWLQAALVLVVSLPVQRMMSAPAPGFGWQHVAGGAAFVIGLACESVGDWQLARFKADPANAGRVMDRGLWRYTRHPNYFGDFLVWWGLFGLSVTRLDDAWTALGPIAMTVLLLRVSGVSLLEQDIGERRPGYADYVRRTSAFVPWPPRDARGRTS